MWAITRIPGKMANYRKRGPLNEIGIAIQIFQIAYVVITAIIIIMNERKGHMRERQRKGRINDLKEL